jgi:hypothetical protein
MTTIQKIKDTPTIHLDKLGQELAEGNYVAGCHRNSMYICKIIKINKKMLRILDIKCTPSTYGDIGWLVYSCDTVKLSGEEATAYILKYA